MKVVRILSIFAAVSGAAVTAQASHPGHSKLVARDGVSSNAGVFTIFQPADATYEASGFVLDVGSNLNGICAGLGYGAYIDGSMQVIDRVRGRRSLIDAAGNAIGVTWGNLYIGQLSCAHPTPAPVPAHIVARGGIQKLDGVFRVHTPADYSVDPQTSFVLSLSSDPNGICRALGFGAFIPNSMAVREHVEGRRTVIGIHGERVCVERKPNYIASLDCMVR